MHSEFKLTNWTIPTSDHDFKVTLNSDIFQLLKVYSRTLVIKTGNMKIFFSNIG
jgi:hypothetical protein